MQPVVIRHGKGSGVGALRGILADDSADVVGVVNELLGVHEGRGAECLNQIAQVGSVLRMRALKLPFFFTETVQRSKQPSAVIAALKMFSDVVDGDAAISIAVEEVAADPAGHAIAGVQHHRQPIADMRCEWRLLTSQKRVHDFTLGVWADEGSKVVVGEGRPQNGWVVEIACL